MSTILKEEPNRKNIILTGLIFFLYTFILPKQSLDGDMHFLIAWSIYIREHGLWASYTDYTNNYMPLFRYVFWLFGTIQGDPRSIDENIYIIKIFPLIFCFLGAWAVSRWTVEREYKWFAFFLLIINPIYLYNAYLWGQMDAIHSFFVFVACVMAVREKVLYAGISFLLAVNFKLQAIVYFPLVGLLMLPVIFKVRNIKKVFGAILSIVIIQVLIILPFWLHGDLKQVWNVVYNSGGLFGSISANAFNIWQWIVNEYTYPLSDDRLYFGITAKSWGLWMFYLASFILLFPLLWKQIQILSGKIPKWSAEQSIDIMLLTGALVNMNFFFFCTQMHERYSHPTMLFALAYSIRHRKWHLSILFLTAYFLNLEFVMRYVQWENYNTLIFDPRFVAALFFIFIASMYKDLYKIYSAK